MREFEIKHEHMDFDNYKRDTEKYGFNTIVISGPCVGNIPDNLKVGRLVQVRKESGAFGSDTILIRTMDGDLQSFHNQSFFKVVDEYKSYYEELFKDLEIDVPNRTYTICNEHKAEGFVVENMDCTNGKTYGFAMSISVKKDE